MRHFVARIAAEENRPVTGVSGNAMAMLGQLNWPGNVRQLENAVYRAVVMSDGGQLGPGVGLVAHAHGVHFFLGIWHVC